MFRIAYICCDVISFVLGLLAPITVFHWLLRVSLAKYPLLMNFVNQLNGLFDPVNTVISAAFHPPTLHFNGQTIPIEQGIQGLILSLGFLGFNFLSEFLKTSEQRQEVAYYAEVHRQRLQKLKEEENQNLLRAIVNRRYLVHVDYAMAECSAGTTLLEEHMGKNQAKVLHKSTQSYFLEFPVLNKAIAFCKDASISVLKYYQTLRPMDPQPPFKISFTAPNQDEDFNAAMSQVQEMSRYAAANQVVLSSEVKDGLEKDGLSQAYYCQSIGLFNIGNQQKEIFKLLNRKPNQEL